MRKFYLRALVLGAALVRLSSATAQTAPPPATPPATSTPPACTTSKKPGWTVYVTAHPDDWQLFMGSDACDDVKNTRRKVVFICLTAGQADLPDDAYWQAREAGCRTAIQQATRLQGTPGPLLPATTLTINKHSVVQARSANTVAYFLHLPDGNTRGQGQARGGHQSLQQLRTNGRSMQPLDGGPAYQSWNELVETVRQIMRREAVAGPFSVHAPVSNEKLNPNDHSDHRMAGLVALAATARAECLYRLHIGYDINKRPANLTSEQAANKLLVYRAYSQAMRERGQYPSWDASHLSFIGRQYTHVRHSTGAAMAQANATTPNGPTTPAPSTGSAPDEGLEEAPSANVVLEPSFPNPFDMSTLFVYRLPAAAPVWLRVFDAQGREVVRLLDGAVQTAGSHEQWIDVSSLPAAGMYIAELRTDNQRRTRRFELIR